MTAKAMREASINQKGWKDEELPYEKSISNILNRFKKVSETDAIFDNIKEVNKASDLREDSLRIRK